MREIRGCLCNMLLRNRHYYYAYVTGILKRARLARLVLDPVCATREQTFCGSERSCRVLSKPRLSLSLKNCHNIDPHLKENKNGVKLDQVMVSVNVTIS